MKQQILQKKIYKLQKEDINQLQEKRKSKNNAPLH